MKFIPSALLTLLLASCAQPQAAMVVFDDKSTSARIEAHLIQSRLRWIEFRHELHRNPELSGEEKHTAASLARELERIGLKLRRGVGGHGLVALLEGARPGRTIGFRADMDAVRSTAHDPADYRSTIPGVRHICGHDVHSSIGLALAETLHAVRDTWAGTLVFYFQPAEETATGAKAMIKDGALNDPRPEECYAYHCSPMAVGTIGVTPGRALAMRDQLRLLISGSGDQQAAANRLRDAIQNLTTLADPNNAPSQTKGFLVARAGGIAQGPKPGELTLSAQITLTDEVERERGREKLQRSIDSLGINNVSVEVQWTPRTLAGVYNDPVLVEANAALMQGLLGDSGYQVDHSAPVPFSEDFGSFQEEAPGVMYWLGVASSEPGTSGSPHSPNFVADDRSIELGVRCMAQLLLQRLSAR